MILNASHTPQTPQQEPARRTLQQSLAHKRLKWLTGTQNIKRGHEGANGGDSWDKWDMANMMKTRKRKA